MVYCSLPLVAQPLQRSSLQSISLLPSKAVAVHCVGHQEGIDGIRRTQWQLFSLSTFPTMKSRTHHARVLCTFPSFWGNWDFCLVHLRQNLPDTGTLISNIGESERITGFSAALFQHLFSPATGTDGNTFPTPHPPPQPCHLPCLLFLLFFYEPHILAVGDKGESQFLLVTSFIAIIVSFLVTGIRFCSLLLYCKKQAWRDGMGEGPYSQICQVLRGYFFFPSPLRGKSTFSLIHLKSASFGEIPVQLPLQNKMLDNLNC